MTTIPTSRLRNSGENWGEYVEFLDEALFVPAPDRKDYEDFNTYYAALSEHRANADKNACLTMLRHLVASLRATDLPQLELLNIAYYGGGDSGEIEYVDLYSTPTATHEGIIDDELDKDLREALDNFGWRLAYDINPGFEISDGVVDGATGTIAILSKGDEWEITVDHSARITSTEDSSYVFA